MAEPNPLADPNVGVTTVEDSGRKQLVPAYAERPTVKLGLGVVGCPYCGNTQFRRSRLRFTDLMELLTLRYPVRCTRCSQRQYTGVHIAFLAYPPKQVGPRAAQGNETWQSWTGPTEATSVSARPLSTAMGPKARNLEPVAKAQHMDPPARIAPRKVDSDIW